MQTSQESFRDFIKRMLQIAKINEEYRELFTDEQGMQLFLRAVTHPSYDPKNNYELYEFIGDGIIKGVNGQYVTRRFPELASGSQGTAEGVLTKVRRLLEQKKTLADVGLKLGFWQYVRADEETLSRNRNKTLEDVVEAFIGALVEILDERVKRGIGYNYAYNFIETCLNEIEIDLSKEALDDPITLLHELYKANDLKGGVPPLKWGDVLYDNYKYYVPKVNTLPQTGREGELVFLVKSDIDEKNIKNIYIWSSGRWISAWSADASSVKFYPPPPPTKPIEPGVVDDTISLIWYSSVYGFLNTPQAPSVNKTNAQTILANPARYGGEKIGQAIAFKLQDARKSAAQKALKFLEKKGISRQSNQ